jgi:hypothetical protein
VSNDTKPVNENGTSFGGWSAPTQTETGDNGNGWWGGGFENIKKENTEQEYQRPNNSKIEQHDDNKDNSNETKSQKKSESDSDDGFADFKDPEEQPDNKNEQVEKTKGFGPKIEISEPNSLHVDQEDIPVKGIEEVKEEGKIEEEKKESDCNSENEDSFEDFNDAQDKKLDSENNSQSDLPEVPHIQEMEENDKEIEIEQLSKEITTNQKTEPEEEKTIESSIKILPEEVEVEKSGNNQNEITEITKIEENTNSQEVMKASDVAEGTIEENDQKTDKKDDSNAVEENKVEYIDSNEV